MEQVRDSRGLFKTEERKLFKDIDDTIKFIKLDFERIEVKMQIFRKSLEKDGYIEST